MAMSLRYWPEGVFSLRPFFLFLLFFSVLLIYAVSPQVYVGDSGLFTSASYFLGSAHPPAYPLYISFGKLMTFLPFGNIAFKVNLMNALFGALTALIAYNTASYITKNSVVSIFAPLTTLSSPLFIAESSKAEVYTLNAFLIMAIFYLGLRVVKEDNYFRMLLLSFFLLGIGMGNHHTIGLMLIPLLFVVITKWKELPSGTIPFSILLVFIGFSVYLMLYLRTLAGAFVHYSPVSSFTDFLQVFFRVNFGKGTIGAVQHVSDHSSGWFYALNNIGSMLSREIHPLLWVFIVAGVIGLWKDKKAFWYVLVSLSVWVLLAKVTFSGKTINYRSFSIISPFFLPLIPLCSVIASTGIGKSYEKIKQYSQFISRALIPALMIFQILFVSIAVQKASLTDYFIAYGWIKDVSKILPPRSFYLAFGDNPGFLSFYGFGVERLRDDVVCLDAATGVNNFRFTISPGWKFSVWYPELDLYKKTKILPFDFFNHAARAGKLYASSADSLPGVFKEEFDVRQYVLSAMVLPRGSDYRMEEQFAEDFERIDYLPVLMGKKEDILAAEIIKNYIFATWMNAQYLASNNAKDADYFYRLALLLASKPLKYDILREYVYFIGRSQGTEAAQKYLQELKDATSDGEMQRQIEQISSSTLKENGTIIQRPNRFQGL
jgi:hypothetical protein